LLSANFGFLEPHGAQLYRLAALAEHYFPTDANTCLLKLRQFAELLAQDVAARAGLFSSTEEHFVELLGRLSRTGYVPRQSLDLFHHLRRIGNAAAHADHDDHRDALSALKVAGELAIWFVRSFGQKPKLAVGPFSPPTAPPDPTTTLREELERLKAELDRQPQAPRRRLRRPRKAPCGLAGAGGWSLPRAPPGHSGHWPAGGGGHPALPRGVPALA
jgi:type I restriction enzyme, R subunit